MLERGKRVGEYVLVEKLGAGGFGDVWKAEKRTVLDVNHFALKFFRPKEDGVDFDKIGRELAVWKRLRGLPHIISVIELDRFEDYVYVVSDFADGGSLEKFLKDKPSGKASSETEAIRIALEILTGLENLHEKGFVHRDLKPDNILIMNGRFCLADFGISREVKTHSRATGTAGTMEYMSPEAFEKTPSVTPQTDIWAVGVILQRLLTGKLPYPQDDQPSLIAAILMSEPDEMSENVSTSLREIVKKSLHKDRAMRFQSASEMREALQDFWMRQKIAETRTVPPAETLVLEDFDKTAKYEIAPTLQITPIVEDNEKETEVKTAVRRQIREARGQVDEEVTRQSAVDFRQTAPQTPTKKSKTIWISAIALLVFLTGIFGIVGLIVWYKSGNSANKNANTSQANTNTNISNSSSNTNPLQNSIGMEFVRIPAGSFMIDSQDEVTISKEFYLGKHEVTQEQWEKVMGTKPLAKNCPRCPVVEISWEDVQEFIKKLNAKGEGIYRLPTSAEWGYACRAGTAGDYSRDLDAVAWYGWNAGETREVGTKQPNPWGLHDMLGNVSEWTADWDGPYTRGNATDPTGASSGSDRVTRSGSFNWGPDMIRCDHSYSYSPSDSNPFVGVRLVRQ